MFVTEKKILTIPYLSLYITYITPITNQLHTRFYSHQLKLTDIRVDQAQI